MITEPRIHKGYAPGLITQILDLHMTYYGPAWGFGAMFEAGLAREMGAFHARLDPECDLVLSVQDDGGRLLASVTLDAGEHPNGPVHLRWFIARTEARGLGLGNRLMQRVITHLDDTLARPCYLRTFDGLAAARHLYERFGFVLTREEGVDPWSGTVGTQYFERPRPT